MNYSYDRGKTAAMTADTAEKAMKDLKKEVRASLDRLQVLRGHFERGKRADPGKADDWDSMDTALKKTEGPLTVAYRTLAGGWW